MAETGCGARVGAVDGGCFELGFARQTCAMPRRASGAEQAATRSGSGSPCKQLAALDPPDRVSERFGRQRTQRSAVASQLASLSWWLGANSCPGYGPVMSGLPPLAVVAIKLLVPERMDLPGRGGRFDLAAWLPEPIRSEYRSPRLIRRRDVPRAPRSRMHCRDWPAVVRRFDDARMMILA